MKLCEKSLSDCSRIFWEQRATSEKKVTFFFKALKLTINSLESNNYYAFDAHTTTNCCHGIALYVSELIFTCSHFDLKALKEKIDKESPTAIPQWIPSALVELTGLYILKRVRDITSCGKMRTEAKNLKAISPIGVAFCWEVTNYLQKHFANFVTHLYDQLAEKIDPSINLSGVPAKRWGKYSSGPYLKHSSRGVRYAACVYSTQLCLGYLAQKSGKVALVNDLIDSKTKEVHRYVKVLQGTPSGFLPLDLSKLENTKLDESVIVFGGYTKTSKNAFSDHVEEMDRWAHKLPNLILAGDVFYPQFPHVSNDPVFCPKSVIPEEPELLDTLHQHSKVKGVSHDDPTLFLSTHNYPASIKELLNAVKGNEKDTLPSHFSELKIQSETPWISEIADLLEEKLLVI